MRLRTSSQLPTVPEGDTLVLTPEGPLVPWSFLTIPSKVLATLCVPRRRKRSASDPDGVKQSTTAAVPTEQRPPARNSSYESFPAPTFTGRGQPRAFDSRLYPDLIETVADDAEPSSIDGVLSNSGELVLPTLSCPYLSSASLYNLPNSTPPRSSSPLLRPSSIPSSNAKHYPPIPPVPPHLSASLARRYSPTSSTSTSSSSLTSKRNRPLSLRGGADAPPKTRKPLADDQHLPTRLWFLAGGRGLPPTAGSYRTWKGREAQRVQASNVEKGRVGNEGRRGLWGKKEPRGFWGEVAWVLVGARKAERKRRVERAKRKGEIDGPAGEATGTDATADQADNAGATAPEVAV